MFKYSFIFRFGLFWVFFFFLVSTQIYDGPHLHLCGHFFKWLIEYLILFSPKKFTLFLSSLKPPIRLIPDLSSRDLSNLITTILYRETIDQSFLRNQSRLFPDHTPVSFKCQELDEVNQSWSTPSRIVRQNYRWYVHNIHLLKENVHLCPFGQSFENVFRSVAYCPEYGLTSSRPPLFVNLNPCTPLSFLTEGPKTGHVDLPTSTGPLSFPTPTSYKRTLLHLKYTQILWSNMWTHPCRYLCRSRPTTVLHPWTFTYLPQLAVLWST